MADLTNAQKKEWAKTLYLKENLTQQEIADQTEHDFKLAPRLKGS